MSAAQASLASSTACSATSRSDRPLSSASSDTALGSARASRRPSGRTRRRVAREHGVDDVDLSEDSLPAGLGERAQTADEHGISPPGRHSLAMIRSDQRELQRRTWRPRSRPLSRSHTFLGALEERDEALLIESPVTCIEKRVRPARHTRRPVGPTLGGRRGKVMRAGRRVLDLLDGGSDEPTVLGEPIAMGPGRGVRGETRVNHPPSDRVPLDGPDESTAAAQRARAFPPSHSHRRGLIQHMPSSRPGG